uniref:Glucosinolate transporter n=1 Tax=Phyllotreta armoraciae TaxID=1553667 RepID=A0A858Z6B1_9CUCU|nr:glucosinolate transporter [Phyllotreta armoraciae]
MHLEIKENHKVAKKRDSFFMYFCVLTGNLLTLSLGASMSWTSPVLTKLSSNNTEINPLGRPITAAEVSMLAGIPTFTSTFGLLITPKFSDIFGRKNFLLFCGVLMFLSGIGISFSGGNIALMIITRCLFSFTEAYSVTSIYIAEITEDHNRGKWGCSLGIFQQMGHLFGYVIGPFFSIKYFSLIMTAPTLIFLVFFSMVPETPIYLLIKGKENECKNSLRKLRSNKSEEEIELELKNMKENLKKKGRKGNIVDLFKKRENVLALVFSFLPLLIKFSSGVTVIYAFLAPFFDQAGTSFLTGDMVAILIAVFKVTSYVLSSLAIEKFGRRNLFLISTTGTALSLFFIGVYFFLQSINSSLLPYLQWLPLTGLILTVSFFGIGLGPVPHLLTAELPPVELRATMAALVLSSGYVVVFVFTSLYPFVSEMYGNEWCVWWFSLNCAVGTILMYFFLPETKGKSLDEIQDMLKNYSELKIR